MEYEGAAHHVVCGGDRGESVFPSEGDRETFLDPLAEACEREKGGKKEGKRGQSEHIVIMGLTKGQGE
jgi:hypothetical protein